MTNFFTSIGNAFKAGWNNGNIAKGFKAAGMAAMGGVIINETIKASKHCCRGGSVFNGYLGGGCCNSGMYSANFGFGGCGLSGNEINNPLNILNTPMTQYSSYGRYSSNFGMLNSFMGGNDYMNLYSYPANITSFYSNKHKEQVTDTVPHTNNADAGKVTGQDATAGEEFDKAITAFGTGDSQEATLFTYSNADEYINNISELGKSYAAFIDQAGNKDGEVTKEEFVAKFVGDPNDPTEKAIAELVFDKVDQNGNEKADWKELASMMATLDQNSNNKLDGKLSKQEYENWLDKMCSATDTSFATNVQNKYKQLFGDGK